MHPLLVGVFFVLVGFAANALPGDVTHGTDSKYAPVLVSPADAVDEEEAAERDPNGHRDHAGTT